MASFETGSRISRSFRRPGIATIAARRSSLPAPLLQRRSYLLSLVGLATFALALGVAGAANLWLLRQHDPLVYQFRATLSYRSAIIGDGLVLPLLNMVIASHFLDWDWRPRWALRYLPPALLLGGGLTAFFHWYQAAFGLINWTMPEPGRWTSLGVYHALFMGGQLSLMFLFLLKAGAEARYQGDRRVGWRAAGLVAGVLALFLSLLIWDYFLAA